MPTQAELETLIATLDADIQSGVQSVTTDGTTTRVNLDQMRRERDRLQRQLATQKMQRPMAVRIDLGGF